MHNTVVYLIHQHHAYIPYTPYTDIHQHHVSTGRRDLINIISVCGGMTEVALLLGLRAARRPV